MSEIAYRVRARKKRGRITKWSGGWMWSEDPADAAYFFTEEAANRHRDARAERAPRLQVTVEKFELPAPIRNRRGKGSMVSLYQINGRTVVHYDGSTEGVTVHDPEIRGSKGKPVLYDRSSDRYGHPLDEDAAALLQGTGVPTVSKQNKIEKGGAR